MNSDHKEDAIYCHECGKYSMMKNNTLIYVAGPTCVGKTKFSIELAKKFKTEILSCDSRQFYNEISIGTAVPIKTSSLKLNIILFNINQSRTSIPLVILRKMSFRK